jgi:hypothetical protein
MPLDVYVQPRLEPVRVGGDYEYICSLDDDGYYWFLFPLFEDLAKQTGQWIDLYGGAAFAGPTLDDLARTLTAAGVLVEKQPPVWEVVIGVRMGPVPEEVRCAVDKQQIRALLDKLEAAVHKAKAAGTYVTFMGD